MTTCSACGSTLPDPPDPAVVAVRRWFGEHWSWFRVSTAAIVEQKAAEAVVAAVREADAAAGPIGWTDAKPTGWRTSRVLFHNGPTDAYPVPVYTAPAGAPPMSGQNAEYGPGLAAARGALYAKVMERLAKRTVWIDPDMLAVAAMEAVDLAIAEGWRPTQIDGSEVRG